MLFCNYLSNNLRLLIFILLLIFVLVLVVTVIIHFVHFIKPLPYPRLYIINILIISDSTLVDALAEHVTPFVKVPMLDGQ